ncbi:MAG: alcohol dehydrogenase [Labilithrix sp.]|nr:alcohol dehydrogenase [Labilithrix sp.]
MRAAVYESFGDPERVLHLAEQPLPTPRPGQARIRMTRSAIHNHDLWTIRGTYGQRPSLPAIGGSEAAGVVESLGEGVTNLAIGQRVTGFALGAWAELFVSTAASLVPLPDAISDDVGCQLVAMPLSALALLEHYRVGQGEWLVQNAANGAVGKTLATIAKGRGIRVIHLVRSETGQRELAAAGIDDAISTDDPDWRAQVTARVGEGHIRYAFDSIGGQAASEILSLLAPGGTLVAFGSMSGAPMSIDSGELIFRQTKVEGFWLSKHPLGDKAPGMVQELVHLVESHELELPVAGTYGLEQAKEAVAASVKAGKQGKVLFRG